MKEIRVEKNFIILLICINALALSACVKENVMETSTTVKEVAEETDTITDEETSGTEEITTEHESQTEFVTEPSLECETESETEATTDNITETSTNASIEKNTQDFTQDQIEYPSNDIVDESTQVPTENSTEKTEEVFSEEEILAKEIINNIITPNMTEFEKVMEISNWLSNSVSYDYDNYYAGTVPSESYSAIGALKYGVAVCGGYADAFRLLAEEAGLEAIYVSGVADNGEREPHAWNQVKINGNWYNIDATWNDMEEDSEYYEYCPYAWFLLSDKEFYGIHIPSGKVNVCDNTYDRQEIATYANNNFINGVGLVYGNSPEDITEKIADLWEKGYKQIGITYYGVLTPYEFDKYLPIWYTARRMSYMECGFTSHMILYELNPLVNSYTIVNNNEELYNYIGEKYNEGVDSVWVVAHYTENIPIVVGEGCELIDTGLNYEYRLLCITFQDGMNKWWENGLEY